MSGTGRGGDGEPSGGADRDTEGFLARWSRRKREQPARAPEAAARPASAGPAAPVAAAVPVVPPDLPAVAQQGEPALAEASAPPPPTLEDVAALAPGEDVSRFVARGVDEVVKRAALKKLFSDPHFNVMDGLDVYIDDYTRSEPIPEAMLRQMHQSKFLGLFAEEERDNAGEAAPEAAAAAPPAPSMPPDDDAPLAADPAPAPTHHEDPDLQLQPDDAARRPGAEDGAGPRRV